jgi:hypothetical protein
LVDLKQRYEKLRKYYSRQKHLEQHKKDSEVSSKKILVSTFIILYPSL